MWRTRAIVSTLIEDVAALRHQTPGSDPEPSGLELLDRAKKRARLVVALDWIALAVLFVFRDPGRAFLPAGPSVEAVFTLGVLAVAVHSGFRLGQLEKLAAVERACRELLERDPGADEG